MQVKVRDIRSGQTRVMSKKFADILVKLKKATYIHDVPDASPALGPTYNTAMLTAQPAARKVKDADTATPPKKKRKRKKKAKADKKEYLTKVMTAEE